AAETVDHDAIVGLEVGDRHVLGEARDRHHAIVVGDGDHVVAAGPVDDHGVRLSVITADRRPEVDVDLADVGSGQIVDRDGVDASASVELDVLDAVDIHDDGTDVAGHPHSAAVRRDVELLVDVGAVEHQRVVAPASPSTTSLPSPGFQTNVSLPLPRKAVSLPRPPMTVSLPSPPRSVSAPRLPVMVSLPAPPSIVSLIQSALRCEASMVSSPPRPLTTKVSLLGSAPSIVTCSGSPVTKTVATSLLVMLCNSLPAVPLTVTVSAAPSPTPVPGTPARSMSTSVTPVPVRSPTTMLSAPALAPSWMRSMLLRSMVTVPMSRVSFTRPWLAVM